MSDAFYSNAPNNMIVSKEEQARIDFENRTRDMYTALPVKVTAVNAGSTGLVGTVDCVPLVKGICANNQTYDYPEIFNAPYFRLQGGSNGIVCDPEVGDIGIAIFASRDISGVKRARGTAPCGSYRRFSLSDAFYVGGTLNGALSQFIDFSTAGITILSPTKIKLVAPEVEMDTPLVTIHGQMNMTGEKGSGASTKGGITNTGGTVSSNGTTLETHVHKGVQSGSSNTGTPV